MSIYKEEILQSKLGIAERERDYYMKLAKELHAEREIYREVLQCMIYTPGVPDNLKARADVVLRRSKNVK